MNELIKITETNGKRAVSARELHCFLEIETRFDIWIKRMFEYGFEEFKDYETCTFLNSNNQIVTDYAISLDCSKEISMIQRSEKGKIARQYFLECEKVALQTIQQTFKLPQSYPEALRQLADKTEQYDKLELQVKEEAPLVNFAKALQISEHNILIGELAKILKQNGIEIGQNKLFELLREKGYLCKAGEQWNLPTQMAMELGLFEVKRTTINNADGSVRVTKTTKVKPRGIEYFINKLIKIK